MSQSFADELRARSDESLEALFSARTDLINPVPSDITALAARANSVPSVLRARDALTRFEYDVLTAAALCDEPFSESEVISLTSKKAGSVFVDLIEKALIYKDGKKYRLPSSVRAVIGEFPAGLGPKAKQPIKLDLLKKAPAASLEMLKKMMFTPKGQVADTKKPNAALKWLLENDFLVAIDSTHVILPREVGLYLRGGSAFPELSEVAPLITGEKRFAKNVELAAIANVSTLLRWAEELAHNWSDEPPVALKSGGLGVRDLKQTAEHLGVDEQCAAFVCEILFLAGLIVVDGDDRILPTTTFDAWLIQTAEERWFTLASVWRETSRVSGLVGKSEAKNIAALGPELDRSTYAPLKKLILQVLCQTPELDPDAESLRNHINWLAPGRANSEYISYIRREAEWFGITGQGAISSFGKAFNEERELGITAALPKPVDHIMIQSDNSAIAPGPLEIEIANELGTLADIESRGGATVYRFSEGSIRRGLDHGKTGDQIRDFLKQISKTPIPQPLDYLITDVSKRHGRLRVGVSSTYIRCEDEGIVQQILHDKKLEDIHLRKLAPQVLISDNDLHDLTNALRDAGYLPALENDEGILISAPTVARAKSRPRPPRVIVELTRPETKLITAAVRALRAGEKASVNKPKDIPRTTANETLELLNQYIEEQASLAIGYADTNGGVSQKLIDPISISLGTLVARDHGTGEIAYFRIPRITGVAPAEK